MANLPVFQYVKTVALCILSVFFNCLWQEDKSVLCYSFMDGSINLFQLDFVEQMQIHCNENLS